MDPSSFILATVGEWIEFFLKFILHMDEQLPVLIKQYGPWIYGILFLVIFCETGLVVTPILPGDSLLFAAGVVASAGELNVPLLILLLTIAAVLGDAVNYTIGAFLGPKVLSGKYPFLKKEYLDKTQRFYDKYGGKTIILARFVPIVRTFAPFLAGVGSMSYPKFASYNVIGGIIWVVAFTVAGTMLGQFDIIRKNLTAISLLIVFVSVLPAILEVMKARKESAANSPTPEG
ncbi:DedA family protein [bacterium]|nr:DedA family protein [bacterium]